MADDGIVDVRLKRIEASLERIEAMLRPKLLRTKRFVDPKLRRTISRSMEEQGLNQSGLAARMFGRGPDGKPKGRDRISMWLSGKNYPSEAMLKRLAQFVDIV